MSKKQQKQELTPKEQHMISCVYRFLPVLADFIEDLNRSNVFPAEVRQAHTKNLVYKIRKFDEFLIKSNENHSDIEQVDAQIQFRNLLKELIPYEQQSDI